MLLLRQLSFLGLGCPSRHRLRECVSWRLVPSLLFRGSLQRIPRCFRMVEGKGVAEALTPKPWLRFLLQVERVHCKSVSWNGHEKKDAERGFWRRK